MTKSKWIVVSVSVVSAGFLLASLVSARPGDGRFGRGGPGFFLHHVLRQLELSDTQRANIAALKAAHQEKVAVLRSDLKAVRMEVVDQLLGEVDVTTSDFTEQQADLSQLRSALFEERLALGLAIRAELTPAQRAEAATLVEELRARWAKRRTDWAGRRAER